MTAVGRRFNDAVTQMWTLAAPLYDMTLLQRWVYRPAQDEIIAALRKHDSRRIADVACGTGILAARIHTELTAGEIYGIDMSDGMLEKARARCAEVHWLKAPAERLPFDDGALDAVVSSAAFHFFDQPAAMREFHRVLAPGGLAALATLSPPQLPFLAQFSAGPNSPAHNPSPREMRTLFGDAGFRISDQHRVRRPLWTRGVWDLITLGTR